MFSALSASRTRSGLLALVLFAFGGHIAVSAQTNGLGNGGIHSIQGRIYLSNGRRSDVTGLRIRLINFASNDLSLIADSSGAFTFKNLIAGSYVVRVEGGDLFEDIQENVTIDDPGSSTLSETVRLRGGAKIANVQIFLKPKAVAGGVPPEVLYAKLAGVPKAAVELYDSAQRAIIEKDDNKAISQLRAALAIHKEFSLAWNDLGVLLEKAGDVPGAVEAFRAAVKFDQEAFGNLLNLGCILVEAGDYKDAERYLASALFKNGASFRGHFYMGITQLRLGRMDIAEQAFLKAIDIGGPGSARAHYLLAGVYWGAKRYKAAADHLEKYLRLDPDAKDAEKTRQSIAELRKKQS